MRVTPGGTSTALYFTTYQGLEDQATTYSREGGNDLGAFGSELWALSRELELASGSQHDPVRVHAAVAARHVRKASSRRTRSVRREVRWRWTLKIPWRVDSG